MLWLGHRRGHLADWVTQKWVQLTGRRVDLGRHPWLAGPIGKTTGIGDRFFEELAEAENLTVRSGGCPGLVPNLESLSGPDFEPARVDGTVRSFYERTSAYDLDAWGEWSGLFRPFGRLLAAIFSRRLQQLNVPLSALDTSRGVTSEVIQLVRPADGVVQYTGWVRAMVGTRNVLYAGSYSVASVPGHRSPCVKVVFPLPNGNAMVIMRATAHDDGSLTVTSSGNAFGDPGFYFTVHGPDGAVWARYLRTLRESIHVFASGDEVRADHVLSIWRATFLRLHYRLRRKADRPSGLADQGDSENRSKQERGRLTDPAEPRACKRESSLIRWLLDSDPSLRWQVMRDLIGASPDEVVAERARVATEGIGARLLALQEADGCWGGAAWNRGWNSTLHVLTLLRDLGLDPACGQARRAVGLVREGVTWKGCGPPECAANRFFAGEVEPCINGQVAAVGAYFGQDVQGIVDRLLKEQLPDGGWNCEAENGSTRSSFNTTICVLEALLEHELSFGESAEVTAARVRGQEYLLERRLFRRRSTGALIDYDRKVGPAKGDGHAAWTRFAFPTWWHYDVLRGLEYLRRAGVVADERLAEAIELVESKRAKTGRWPLERRYAGQMPVEIDQGEGRPSRWMTLRSLRVLEWCPLRVRHAPQQGEPR